MKQQNVNSKTETWAQTAVRRARCDNQDNAQTPGAGLVKGHGERIRIILTRETIRRENVRHDDTAVCHFGPDGSFVYTNEIGWGIPSHVDDQNPPYCEFNLQGDVTSWTQEGYGQQPGWSYQEE